MSAMFQSSPVATGLLCAALLAGASASQASVVTQTVGIAGSNYYNYTSFGNPPGVPKTITAAFDKFDTSLGTLTGVSFTYDYEFLFSFNITAGGGGGGLGDILQIDGTPFTVGGSTVVLSTASMFSSGTFVVQGSTAPDALALGLFTGPGTFNFEYATSAGFGSGGPPIGSVSATLDLLASSAQVNYTYTAALANDVPEPSSLALVGLAGFATLAVRRRRTASAS